MLLQQEERGVQGAQQAPHLTHTDSAVLIFLGSSMIFSDRLLRTLEFEFKDITVLRVRSVSDLDTLDHRIKLAAKLIIFDEAEMDMLLRSNGNLDPTYHDAGKVLAYSSAKMGRDLRENARRSGLAPKMRFLPMNASLDAWLAALRLLILGEAFVPAELLEKSDKMRPEPDRPGVVNGGERTQSRGPSKPLPNLTAREVEVLDLVSNGLPNKTIAHRLALSEHTVKLHVHHVFGKLNVHNRASATNWYLSHRDGLRPLDNR
ncbi:response regulator transcription factor [Aliiroseovarius sediminis]|uniref:helix-turn-helix transcriptional regulator n=1 Tax=Aliiroseovarius sediminis TaxID=2925839 RepID=UPI001F59B541|nr:response regulator transcription factor [Aliiroseovarius sediminis]MCI2395698.1 response regulator transcription factor [Aliiroseovarius sediminis]